MFRQIWTGEVGQETGGRVHYGNEITNEDK